MNNDRFRFRAWDKKRNRMHQGSIDNLCLSLGGDLMWQFGYNSPELLSEETMQDYILMQCTGLKDSEGNLIWEGDIVEDLYIPVGGGEYDRAIVEWGDTGWKLKGKKYVFPMKQLKIIGNIYEHPHLLTSPQANEVPECT